MNTRKVCQITTCTLHANDHGKFLLPFTASASTTTITLSPVGGEVLVDDVQVTNCSLRTATDRIPLLRSQRTPAFISSSLAELSASWWIVDEQSGVQEYLWALGTVPGARRANHEILSNRRKQLG